MLVQHSLQMQCQWALQACLGPWNVSVLELAGFQPVPKTAHLVVHVAGVLHVFWDLLESRFWFGELAKPFSHVL